MMDYAEIELVEGLWKECYKLRAEISKQDSELLQLREQTRWHKYPDEKPETEGEYQTYRKYRGEGCLDIFEDGKWFFNDDVTHWRDLPAPPEEE